METVSIIVPIYNASQTLSRAIESVLAQTYSNWELLLIDDASSDDSARIISSYEETNPQIKSYCFTENQGVSFARGKGVEMAHGDYICFLDADDEFLPDALELFLKTALDSNCDIVFSSYQTRSYSYEAKQDVLEAHMIPSQFLNKPINSRQAIDLLFTEESVGGFHFNKMYRHDLLIPDLFNTSLNYCEDLYINFHLLLQDNFIVSCLEKPVYTYDRTAESATKNLNLFRGFDGSFSYKASFQEMEALLGEGYQVKGKYKLHLLIMQKYFSILTYEMYRLMTAEGNHRDDILKLSREVRRQLSNLKEVYPDNKKARRHILLLAHFPLLYQKLKYGR